MKNYLLLLSAFLMCTTLSQAQLGVSAGHIKSYAKSYNRQSREFGLKSFNRTGLQFGFDYRFPLKNNRWELIPEFSFHSISTEENNALNNTPTSQETIQMYFVQANFNWHYYPFRAKGALCPATKDAKMESKNIELFLRFGPGASLINSRESEIHHYSSVSRTEWGLTTLDFGLNLRAGIGLDFRLNKILTISPLFQFTHTLRMSNTSIFDNGDLLPLHRSTMSQYFLGIRTGIRVE